MKKYSEFIAEMKKLGDRLGSNDGGTYEDHEGKHYIKSYKDPNQTRSEVLTSKIYKHMGIHTPDHHLVDHDGKPSVKSKWNPHMKPMHLKHFHNLNHDQHTQVGRLHHAAVLTNNKDAFGLVYDNVMKHKKTGDLHSIDHGSSFNFKAKGQHKEYHHDPTPEIEDFKKDHPSGRVFSHVFHKDPGAIHRAMHSVKHMDMHHIHHLFKTSGLPNHEELHKTFVERRKRLMKHYGYDDK